jgi:hypothetical protein
LAEQDKKCRFEKKLKTMKNLLKRLMLALISLMEYAVTPIKFENGQPLSNGNFAHGQPQGKMAKIKFGMMMTDARNKLGGQVFSKNRGGAYIRTKVTPVNPATTFQLAVRAVFAFLSQNWRALTEAQRDAWNTATANFTSTDIFADVRTPSGINLYKKLNQNLSTAGQAFIATPPLPATVLPVLLDNIVADAAPQTLTLNDAIGPVPAGHTLIIEATPNLSPGKNFVKSEFAIIGTRAAATVFPIAAIADYTAKFGAMVAGQKVFVRCRTINNTTGQASGYSQAETIVLP